MSSGPAKRARFTLFALVVIVIGTVIISVALVRSYADSRAASNTLATAAASMRAP